MLFFLVKYSKVELGCITYQTYICYQTETLYLIHLLIYRDTGKKKLSWNREAGTKRDAIKNVYLGTPERCYPSIGSEPSNQLEVCQESL